jgi:type IV pilus assembly protein PilB
MNDIGSIDNLIHPSDDDENNPVKKLEKKQAEIQAKSLEQITAYQAKQTGLNYINLVGFPISPEAICLIEEERAKELKLVCFYYDGQNIRLACLKQTKEVLEELENLEKKYYCQAKLYIITKNSLEYALDVYRAVPKVRRTGGGVEIKEKDLEKFKEEINDFTKLNEKINQVNTSDIVTLLLATAIKIGSSDIHIESEEEAVAIRFRVDGVLQEAAKIKKSQWKKIISRMKILAKVKINVNDKPQDGRYTIFLKSGKIDIRSSFLPTAYGESVVMRLLDSKAVALEFESLGMDPYMLKILEREISKPNGLILTTGPTGSGKTTTLYAILKRLNKPGTKIITLEDPIEYQLEGINQSQVEESHGYSFANGLRSILRQDPNIVMVGEIRDLETAEISVQASLTGHLVLSTLHTNDAAGVIPRMVDIGVKPYFLVPSINAIVGQRLARKLCPHCKEEHILNEEEKEQVQRIMAVISPKANIEMPTELPTIYKAGKGCEKCNGLKYKGRVGIFEIFTMDEKIKQLTIDKAPAFQILKQAIENGLITMLQDGILKCLDGITSLEEIYRVVGDFSYVDELYDNVISQTIGRGVKIKEEEYKKAEELSSNIGEKSGQARREEVSSGYNKIINFILALAVSSNAGDIHIEPAEKEVKVRFRIDGVMHDILSLPKNVYLPLIAEIKILAGFATNIKRATLDGRFSIYVPDKKIDCRLSIIAGGHGETVVIRLLDNTIVTLGLESLGIISVARTSLDKAIKKTKGIIITSGPTGSGKTTTLYGILRKLNTDDTKIITVEDPIEYNLPGVIQTQIDQEKGYTFASAMRSLLRQNPNIMMIGEIRDEETAKIAIEAAMTGHLVLSTIHANSAAGAISRLVGLNIDRSALANAIEFSIGQRLVRKLCPHCKKEVKINDEQMVIVQEALAGIKNKKVEIPKKLSFYHSTGCPKCNQLGYKGRLGLYETITTTPVIQEIIQKETMTDQEIEQIAIDNGELSILQDAILKALNGQTSLEEILRVI